MKLSVGLKRDFVTRGSVLLIAGFAIFVLTENACSDSSATNAPTVGTADASTPPAGCFAGETAKQVGGETLCCRDSGSNVTCFNTSRIGNACVVGGAAPAPAEEVTLAVDVCVTDSCNGDRTPTNYDAQTIQTITSLACVSGTLTAAGSPSKHEVDRVCTDVAPLTCAHTSYSYDYGYVTSYGYGYYGGAELMSRAVSVSSSICTASGGSPTPCDVGAF